MASAFSSRNLIYWWVFLTSFVFLQQPAREWARNFRNSQTFSPNNIPFSLADGITRLIDDCAKQTVAVFQFDPNAVVVRIGNTVILDGTRVGVLLILLLLVLAIRAYTRAVASPHVYDDVIALLIAFFVYHLVAQTLRAIRFAPNAQGLTLGDQMIRERSTWVWFMAFVVIAMTLGGRGWTNSQVFWKGVIELFFVWLFLIPNAAAANFAALLEALAAFGSALTTTTNFTIALIWAIIGLLLAVHRLYTGPPPILVTRPPAGGGGGGGAARASGGGGGGGSLLKRLTGGRG